MSIFCNYAQFCSTYGQLTKASERGPNVKGVYFYYGCVGLMWIYLVLVTSNQMNRFLQLRHNTHVKLN